MRGPSTGSPNTPSTLALSTVILVAGFLVGAPSNSGALHIRETGLDIGSVAFLLVAPLGLIVGEIVAIRWRAWVSAVLLPFAVALGLVVFGPV